MKHARISESWNSFLLNFETLLYTVKNCGSHLLQLCVHSEDNVPLLNLKSMSRFRIWFVLEHFQRRD